jgi:hypothetical protein
LLRRSKLRNFHRFEDDEFEDDPVELLFLHFLGEAIGEFLIGEDIGDFGFHKQYDSAGISSRSLSTSDEDDDGKEGTRFGFLSPINNFLREIEISAASEFLL